MSRPRLEKMSAGSGWQEPRGTLPGTARPPLFALGMGREAARDPFAAGLSAPGAATPLRREFFDRVRVASLSPQPTVVKIDHGACARITQMGDAAHDPRQIGIFRRPPDPATASTIFYGAPVIIFNSPGRAPFAREEGPSMELAAAVLFSSVVLWFIEEAADEHV